MKRELGVGALSVSLCPLSDPGLGSRAYVRRVAKR